jgi:hypothetical protein
VSVGVARRHAVGMSAMVCMCEEEGKGAGDERGRQNRLHSRQVEMQARDRPLVDWQVMLQSENLRVEHSSGLA